MPRPAIGIEVVDSGTRMVAAVSAERGARRWSTRLDAPPAASEAVSHMHALIERVLRDTADPTTEPDAAAAIGIALAGAVDAARGTVREVRLASGWQDFRLADALAERWGGPVAVQSTTQSAALAEARLGAGRDHDHLLYLRVGRTVAAAFVVDGRVYYGAGGRAGDLAHWLVRPDGPRCSCGARGHLEPIASAQSLVRTMIGRAVDHPESNAAMLRISNGRAEAMTADQVVHLAAEGDPVARSVVDDAVEALGLCLANVVAAFDPGVMILGGPLVSAGSDFLEPLRVRLAAFSAHRQLPPVRDAELEPAAALIGAVLSATERRDD